MNETQKYVVSATLPSADWNNSQIVGPYSPQAVQDVKDRVDGDIYVSGSGTLVRAMLADGLVDELHLFVFPLVLGRGQRLFPEGTIRMKFRTADAETYESGVVHLALASAQ
jgi:dihydrofolate reductase